MCEEIIVLNVLMRSLAQVLKYDIAFLNDRVGQLQACSNIGIGMLDASLRILNVYGALHHETLELGSDLKDLISHRTILLSHDEFCEIEVSKNVRRVSPASCR